MNTTPSHAVKAQSASTETFSYTPPAAASSAQQILVKPSIGYPAGPPVTVSMGVLGAVLNGLRQVNPSAEILIVEGVCSATKASQIFARSGLYDLLDEGMQVLDADQLPQREYTNRSRHPVRFDSMLAPLLLSEVDCRISVGTLKRTQVKGRPLISASLKNLYGLFPRAYYKTRSPKSRGQLHRPSVPQVLQDVYFCIGHLFDGGVVDIDQKFTSDSWQPDQGEAVSMQQVVWGDDLLEVDRLACQVGEEPIPDYLDTIDSMRHQQTWPYPAAY